ncbi:hypothetical protein [Nocardioides massiliensis]|uniref:Uncharacterized protein n=1 Tax=Nocardioides massiliensis TaxID=1325935 RepID=A0ABT9NJS7_9ACTN|nr:hypothetical protein [Nocardioides massiliensis]MDP9820487.1 hypothetical protein [Nocardioides massiliensis]
MTNASTPTTVGERLAVMDTKLDVLIQQRTDHEERLRTLERFRWVLLGVAAASGPVFSKIAPHL